MDFKQFYKTMQFDIDNEIRTVYQATQGDTKSRGLLVDLIVGGVKTPVTTETMNFFALKPDGTRVMTAGVKDGDKFRIDFTNQTFAVPGVLLCTLVLYGTSGEKIADRKFKMTVDSSIEDGAIISEDERGILDRAFDLASDIVPRLEALDVPLLENVEQEVNTARGTEATLGARLDSTDAQLNDIANKFQKSSNLFNKNNIIPNKTVNKNISGSLRPGDIVDNMYYSITKNMSVTAGDIFAVFGMIRVGFYSVDNTFISYIDLTAGASFTIPPETSYMVVVVGNATIETAQINAGSTLLPYEPYTETLKDLIPIEQRLITAEDNVTDLNERLIDAEAELSKKFRVEFETVEMPASISTIATSRLSLIATKKDNYFSARNLPVQEPQDVGYLYLDEKTNKLYYSAGKYDRPEYLFDWDLVISEGSPCKDWVPIITKDGDIVFLTQGKIGRKYPIVYPSNDYTNPVKVITTEEHLPGGLTTDTGACVSSFGDFFIWGEYQANGVTAKNGEPMRIWKVEKPYSNPANWRVVDSWYYSNTGDPWGQNPTREITHFHTIAYDFYTGDWYANTGDLNEFCRVLKSTDDGETWSEVVSNGQKWRTLGYVFTEDACYWGTDAGHPFHLLMKAPRDINGGIDFANSVQLAQFRYEQGSGNGQRTYNTCLVKEPKGLLFLDRAEPRADGVLNLEFWSFEDEYLHLVDIIKSSEPIEITRFGFGNQAVTYYQSTQENGIICGSSSYDRKMSMKILNNTPENRLGVTKIKIIRK